MEAAQRRDNPVAVRTTCLVEMAPDDLQAAFPGFCARIAEEYRIGKAIIDKPLCKAFLIGDAVDIRTMPQLIRLVFSAATRCG